MMLGCKDHSGLTCSLYDLMSKLMMGIGRLMWREKMKRNGDLFQIVGR